MGDFNDKQYVAEAKQMFERLHRETGWETDEEIREKGIQALTRELGPDGMVRFITLYSPGTGDYTAERRARLDAMTPEEEEEEHREWMEDLQKLREMHEEREARKEQKKRLEAAGV